MTLGCLSCCRCICEANFRVIDLNFKHDIPQYVVQSFVENNGRDFLGKLAYHDVHFVRKDIYNLLLGIAIEDLPIT